MFIFSGWNIKKLASYDEGKRNAKFVGSLFGKVFKMGSSKDEGFLEADSFDAFVQSSGVSKKDLKARIKTAKIFIKVYLAVGFLVGAYAIYVFNQLSFLAGISTSIFSVLMFLYAFKEHVIIYKIRHKKLSCTLTEWFKASFVKKTSSNTHVSTEKSQGNQDS